MALTLQPKPTFERTVTFRDADGAELGKAKFVFRHKTRKELNDFWASVGQEGGPADDFEALEAVTVSTDAFEGDPTAAAFEAWCEPLPSAPAQIFREYQEALTKASVKN